VLLLLLLVLLLPLPLPLPLILVGRTLINLGLGAVVPYIDNFAHMGGFVTGLLVGGMFFARKRQRADGGKSRKSASQKCCALISFFLLLAFGGGLVLALVVEQFKEASQWCTFCQYITCLPLEEKFDWIPWTCNNDVALCSIDVPSETVTCPDDQTFPVPAELQSSPLLTICLNLCT